VSGFECMLLTIYFKALSQSVALRESPNVRKNFPKIMKKRNIVVDTIFFLTYQLNKYK
jgi:hypothetical protein